MNKKGQVISVGMFIMMGVAIIVSMVLLSGSGGIAETTSKLSSRSQITNETFSLAAVGSYTDRPNCVNYDTSQTPVLVNSSAAATTLTDGNYTFTTRVSPTTGLKVLTVLTDTGANFAGQSVNATYICLNQGYAEDNAGARSISSLIILLSAIAVMAVIASIIIKQWE